EHPDVKTRGFGMVSRNRPDTAGEFRSSRQPREPRYPCRGARHTFQPVRDSAEVDRRRRGHVLQVALRLAAIPRPAQAERLHPLRDRPLDPRALRVEPATLLAGEKQPHPPHGLVRLPLREPKRAALLRRPRTVRTDRTITAVRRAE